jgi:hypothetical protein
MLLRGPGLGSAGRSLQTQQRSRACPSTPLRCTLPLPLPLPILHTLPVGCRLVTLTGRCARSGPAVHGLFTCGVGIGGSSSHYYCCYRLYPRAVCCSFDGCCPLHYSVLRLQQLRRWCTAIPMSVSQDFLRRALHPSRVVVVGAGVDHSELLKAAAVVDAGPAQALMQ